MEALWGVILVILGILLLALGVLLYLLPAYIAYKNDNPNKNIILVVNILLGWTTVGWVACLIWAIIDEKGNATDKILRNVGGNKYEDLEKLQKLKESGAITDVEFEVEKQKLLR